MVVRRSAQLQALAGLFEVLWDLAVPVFPRGVTGVESGSRVEEEQHLIALLTAGMPDEAIARELRTSYRTLQRRVRTLMETCHATTRFQLGVQAERRGWLTGATPR